MDFFATLILSISLAVSGLLVSQQETHRMCACKDCKCTAGSHCGCYSEQGCACKAGQSCCLSGECMENQATTRYLEK